VGFNEESWLDGLGLPHSGELRVTERFQRLTAGHLQIEGTINDPKMYTKPWAFTIHFDSIPNADRTLPIKWLSRSVSAST